MAEVDAAAREMGLSRSGLVAEALRHFLATRRSELIAAKLNEVYKDGSSAEELEVLRRYRAKMPALDPW